MVISGQGISGRVTFESEKNVSAGYITISLIGRSEVAFNKGRTVYQGSAILFNQQVVLHNGPLKAHNEWKFEFLFPSGTSSDGKKKWQDLPPFNVKDGHEIPPSTIFDTGGIERDNGKGVIVYFLEARFSKSEAKSTSIFSSAEADARVMLYHIPHRQQETSDPQIALVGKESYTISSKLLGASSGLEKKSFFKRFKTPTSIFEISVTAPRVVYAGGPLPFSFNITHDLLQSTSPTAPTVTLKSCSVLLVRTMHAVGRSIMEEDGVYSTMELIAGSNTLSHPLSQTNDLSKILGIDELKTSYGMSLETYNFVQSFRFLVKATFECVDKTLWTEMRSKIVYVLPPLTRVQMEMESDMVRKLQGLNVGGGSEVTGSGGLGILEAVLGVAAATVLSI